MEYKIVDSEKSEDVAGLAVCLTKEIIERTGTRHFNVDVPLAEELCRKFIERGLYTVVAAFDGKQIVGFASLCESHSLYAEGTFGIIQELYVLPEWRSKSMGRELIAKAKEFAKSRQWKRLELCTPPVPEFDRTVSFYCDNGFEITGGYKMKYEF